jgi:hypothetical protein
MSEGFNGFCIGAFVSTLLILTLMDLAPSSDKNILRNAKSDCEKSLPRDQECKIVAIPVSKDCEVLREDRACNYSHQNC